MMSHLCGYQDGIERASTTTWHRYREAQVAPRQPSDTWDG
jgi:hypothetical protein